MKAPTVREQWFEVAAVVCIGVVPEVYHSTALALGNDAVAETFGARVAVVLRSLWVSVPVLYLMHRSGTPAAEFGLVRPRWSDLAIAALVVVGVLAAADVVWQFLWTLPDSELATAGSKAAFAKPDGVLDYALLTALSLANGFTEELVVRAYLITRLRRLWGPLLAVVVSTLLFGAYHTYQGPAAALMITAGGVVFALTFLLFPRLWPLALAHAALDFYGYASIP